MAAGEREGGGAEAGEAWAEPEAARPRAATDSPNSVVFALRGWPADAVAVVAAGKAPKEAAGEEVGAAGEGGAGLEVMPKKSEDGGCWGGGALKRPST